MARSNTRKIKAMIVDDEPLARRNLRALLRADTEIELVRECGSGSDAVTGIRTLHPDLVFLDVQMPEMNGFEVLDKLSGQPLPVIIFVTAYDQYALRAFEVSALDYLLKPFDDARFHKALRQAKQQIEQQDAGELGLKLLSLLDGRNVPAAVPARYITRLMIRNTGRVIFMNVDEIDWIEAYDNYIRLHAGNKAHLLRRTMNELESVLNPEQFARIHRSSIVNLDRVLEMHPHFNGDYLVVLKDGTELRLSRGRKERLEELLRAGSS
jgi:two-component system, LytTR family, response regulator